MRLHIGFVLPLTFFVFALFYIAFTLSLDVERMIGDDLGYDPGSRIIPMTVAVILASTMLWEMVKAARTGPSVPRAPTEEDEDVRVEPMLVLLNIVISILFIAAFRPLGFVLTSCLLLYILTFLNLRYLQAGISWTVGLVGLLGTLAYTVALYSLARWVVRTSFWLARDHGWVAFREPNIQALLVTLFVGLALLAGTFLMVRFVKIPRMTALVQTAAGVTMSVYVVFRLVFLVQLPNGLLTW